MENIFKFKEFSVNQEHCAMRINTDAVLLGAYAEHDDDCAILDIGTGTGVIAMMLAQRHPKAKIWAVEIDQLASNSARKNFQESPFSERLQIVHSDVFNWRTDASFDLIVSNPPFYINSLHNPDPRKKVAKHTDEEFFKGMLAFVANHLTLNGMLQIIIPIELKAFLMAEAELNNLYLSGQLDILSFEDSDPFRCILSFKKERKPFKQDRFVIYKERSQYSDAYRQILKPYFLAF